MNANDLLDHALGKLDGPELERFEAEASSDPTLAGRSERLRERLRLLLDDGEIEPPPGLATRSVALVVSTTPTLRRRTLADLVPTTVPFRWADVAVAASIFFAGLLTLAPAVQRGRERMDQAGCMFNLRQLGVALYQYAGRHQYFPHVAADAPCAEAGIVPVMLRDEGLLNHRDVLRCPCNKHGGPRAADHAGPAELPDMATARTAKFRGDGSYDGMISADYAFHAGIRCPDTDRVASLSCRTQGLVPLAADQPPHDGRAVILYRNSHNHAGRGQNVLFVNGAVAWFRTRHAGRDRDIYLNAENRLAAGVEAHDIVLVPYFSPLNAR